MSNESSKRRPAKGPRVGLAQLSPSLGDLAANLELHRAAVAKAVEDGCELLVFPELSLAGYRLKDSVPDVAVARGSETWAELEKLSEQVAFVVGFVEESPDHLFYNAAAYFEGGKCLAVHRKTYLPTYGMFDEQRYFARGRSIAAFDTKIGRVAMLVCEDMLHPSAVTVAACDGATMIVVPSASPARGVTTDAEADANARSWEAYLQVMARSFGVWVVYCNRTGVEDGVSFWGGSEIVSPAGERLAKAAYYDEDSVSGVLSDDAVRRRRIVNPLVRDEDLDLTINELSRIRGRKVEEAGRETGERPQRGFAPRDRDGRDGEAPPRRSGPPPRFRDDEREHRPSSGFRPKGPYEQRGGFRPRFGRDEEGGEERPRFRRDDEGGERPRFRGGPRFGRDREGGEQDRPRFGGAPRFGRGREGGDERPRFGGAPRFGRDREEGGDRPRFGGAPRFGRDREEGGFGPPRGGRDGGGFAPRPRERQRPEPGGKFGGAGDKPGFRKPGGFKPAFGGAGDKPGFRNTGDKPGFRKSGGKPGGFAKGGKFSKPPRPRTRKDD